MILGQSHFDQVNDPGQNASSPITSYLSKLEPRFKDQNVSYGLRNAMRCLSAPYDPFLVAKIQQIFFHKNWHFSFGYFIDPMTLFRHIWMANGYQIKNQRTKLPPGAHKPGKWHMMSSKVFDLWWPRLTSERSQCQCKPWMSPPNTYTCPYQQQTYRSSQVSGFETVRNANFAWHDLGNQVTGQRS